MLSIDFGVLFGGVTELSTELAVLFDELAVLFDDELAVLFDELAVFFDELAVRAFAPFPADFSAIATFFPIASFAPYLYQMCRRIEN
jgi:hypothetical protein